VSTTTPRRAHDAPGGGAPGRQAGGPSSRPPAGRRAGTALPGARRAFWILVTPFFAGLAVFSVLPILWSAYLSFTEARGSLTPVRFVGIDNYLRFLSDQAFLQSLGTFAVFALFIVPVTMFASLGLALLLHELPAAQALLRSVFFLPLACSYVVASLIWKLGLFSGLPSGVANTLLSVVGLDPISTWLAQSPQWWVVLVSVRLWLQIGFYMLLFLAGLQRIPKTIYEAAAIDGLSAGPRRFVSLTWPQLRPTVAAVLLLLLVAAFQAFDEFINLLPLNPDTRPPLVYLYRVALGGDRDFGLGSAGSLILTAIMVVVALGQNYFFGFAAAEDRTKRRSRRARRTGAPS